MHTGGVTSVQHGRGRRPAEDGRRTSSPTRPPAHQSIWPGLLLAVFGGVLSVAVSRVIPALSALLVAIILGALLANSPMPGVAGLLERTHAGLAVAARRVLRIGIVLLGLQLALRDIVGLGWPMLVGVVLIVAGGIGATVVVGRALRLTSTQTLLIACGFSICGAAAVAAADGVLVRRRSEETVTALALVVVYGTMMIPLVPATAALLGLGDSQAGIFAGGAIHEVAQVVAAGGIIGGPALGIAVVVKLARVLMLAPVLAVLTLTQRTNRRAASRPPSHRWCRCSSSGSSPWWRSAPPGCCRARCWRSPGWRRWACSRRRCSRWGVRCGWPPCARRVCVRFCSAALPPLW
jgi:uncharacterized integral membrane protein (TIGR00698 family)